MENQQWHDRAGVLSGLPVSGVCACCCRVVLPAKGLSSLWVDMGVWYPDWHEGFVQHTAWNLAVPSWVLKVGRITL